MAELKRLTATVVGAGLAGTAVIDALRASNRYELIGVADTSEAALMQLRSRSDVATYTTAEAMLQAKPSDVVCIATYPATHLSITNDVLARGSVRGLLVEKPLGETTAMGVEILRRIKAASLPVVVPHWPIAHPALRQVIDEVHKGRIGQVHLVEIECTNWDLHNAGTHFIQYFLTLVDSPVSHVLMAADTSTRTFRDGIQVETEAVTFARTVSGVRLIVNTGDDIPVSRSSGVFMRISGGDGFIEFDARQSCYTRVTAGQDRIVIDAGPFAPGHHQRHLEHLADQIESGEYEYGIPESSLAALEVVEAAYHSKRAGALVTLPLASWQPPQSGNWDPGAPYTGVGGGRNGREFFERFLKRGS